MEPNKTIWEKKNFSGTRSASCLPLNSIVKSQSALFTQDTKFDPTNDSKHEKEESKKPALYTKASSSPANSVSHKPANLPSKFSLSEATNPPKRENTPMNPSDQLDLLQSLRKKFTGAKNKTKGLVEDVVVPTLSPKNALTTVNTRIYKIVYLSLPPRSFFLLSLLYNIQLQLLSLISEIITSFLKIYLFILEWPTPQLFLTHSPQLQLRAKVSKDRNRFQDDENDLDLSYITDDIIAMGFPSSGIETLWRNSIDDVCALLKKYHQSHFMIWNLSGRSYDYQKFDNQILDYGFPDHHSPPLHVLFKIVLSMHSWLSEDPQNVAVVHCVGGKGRTGTVIAAFLMYSNPTQFPDAQSALNHFAQRRSSIQKGVIQASQIRYTDYFSSILKNNFVLKPPVKSNTSQIDLYTKQNLETPKSIFELSQENPNEKEQNIINIKNNLNKNENNINSNTKFSETQIMNHNTQDNPKEDPNCKDSNANQKININFTRRVELKSISMNIAPFFQEIKGSKGARLICEIYSAHNYPKTLIYSTYKNAPPK